MEEDFAGIGDEGQTERGSIAGFVSAVTDWKVWWLALALTSMVVSLSFNAFFPTLCATMGFNTTVTLLLCAPVRYAIYSCGRHSLMHYYSHGFLRPW
jgi:ABC-type uncharacterized transport system permease subunit